MRKHITLFFVLSLLLILGACGGKDDGQIAANTPDTLAGCGNSEQEDGICKYVLICSD